VIVGPWVLCSGVVGRRDDGEIPEDPEEQYRAVFDIITGRLAAAGASWAAVVDMTTYHTRFERTELFETFRRVREDYVVEPYPAWTAIGVAALFSPTTLVEVKVTAIREEAADR
jgi:enamine deaminase RidA (YjgF/YER057c/UK114 family)